MGGGVVSGGLVRRWGKGGKGVELRWRGEETMEVMQQGEGRGEGREKETRNQKPEYHQ